MPTVIDSLIIELGLDPAKFAAGRRQLEEEFVKGRHAMEAFGKNVETQGHKISDVFSFVRRGAVGIIGAFIGGEAAAFIERIATMDAHTGRLARSIGATTHELSVWQNMVRSVGGTAEDANAVFASLSDTFMNFQMFGQMPSVGLGSLLSRSGVDMRNPNGALERIMRFLAPQGERVQRSWLQQIPGMNESMMFLMMDIMRTPDKMRHLREEIEKIGVASDKSAETAAELQRQTSVLHTSLENLARNTFPALTSIINAIVGFLERHPLKMPTVSIVPGSAADQLIKGWDPPTWLRNLFSDSEVAPSAAGGANPTKAEVMAYIKSSAISQGIDPSVALKVAEGESSFNTNTIGDKGTSFGIFQLHRGGLADVYEQMTGHNASDPRYWHEQIDFSMETAKGKGWGPWHAWHGGQWEGIKGGGGAGAGGRQSSVTIGAINVYPSKADPKAVADQIPAAVARFALLGGINSGLTG